MRWLTLGPLSVFLMIITSFCRSLILQDTRWRIRCSIITFVSAVLMKSLITRMSKTTASTRAISSIQTWTTLSSKNLSLCLHHLLHVRATRKPKETTSKEASARTKFKVTQTIISEPQEMKPHQMKMITTLEAQVQYTNRRIVPMLGPKDSSH